MNKRVILLLVGFLVVAAVSYVFGSGLFSNRSGTDSDKILVSTSFYPLHYFASEIGGDKVEVSNITPAGTEPHDYEPTPQDIVNLHRSDLIIVNGVGLEPWFEKIKDDLEGKTIVVAAEVLGLREVQAEVGEEKDSNIKDPHVWLDPILVKFQVDKILAGFIDADPRNKTTYEENSSKLKGKLDDLDERFRGGLSNCAKRDFVTSHTAFAYLANRYGLTQVAISGLSPDEEPSARQLAEISEFARKNDIKYIFFESLVSPKLSETVANEIGAKTLVLDPVEGIVDDELSLGENYFTKMEANLANLKVALECK